MLEVIKKIYRLPLAPVSEGADRAVAILCRELPFKVHKFPSGAEYNGWIVPKKWKPVKAEIFKGSKKIYDGMAHPLGVIGYSTSFVGQISLPELKKHLFYHPDLPRALVYHCDYYYKTWKRDWGMSVSYNFFKKLKPGRYQVNLQTVFEEGSMKVLDYFLPGRSKETIILNAHDCHAGQANDGPSGIAVGIELMRELKKLKNRRYSYRLIIAPEHLGTVFYLAKIPAKERRTFKYAIFLEMLGNKKRFALQESFSGQSLLDRAAHHYLKHHFPNYHGAPFRKIVGNDEIVWEAPGYEIPCISLSKAFHKEYHSDWDDERIVTEKGLREAAEAVKGIIKILETNGALRRKFNGLMALSNPKYDLYIPAGDPSIRQKISKQQNKMSHLMHHLMRYFDGRTEILDIAEKYDIDYETLYRYLERFKEKKLVEFIRK